LANDKYECVRIEVAENLNTSTTILESLAKDSKKSIHQQVAENSYTPLLVLKTLKKDKDWYVAQAAKIILKNL
jgi:hypothetical protein